MWDDPGHAGETSAQLTHGWRMQLHVEGDHAALYSKNGTDYTPRFRALKATIELSKTASGEKPTARKKKNDYQG